MSTRRVSFAEGLHSFASDETGEAMHSKIGAEAESRLVYLEQSGLESKLESGAEVKVLDLGMGIAANSVAVLGAWFKTERSRLEIVSIEPDLDPIRAAIADEESFPFLQSYRSQLKTLLQSGEWNSECGKATWKLVRGFYPDVMENSELVNFRPDVVFWDFYSPKTCPQLWTIKAFRILKEVCEDSVGVTYCTATAARAAMILAGFYVGYGIGTGAKKETTVFWGNRDRVVHPLAEEWFEHFLRSGKRRPLDWSGSDKELIDAIKKHMVSRTNSHSP